MFKPILTAAAAASFALVSCYPPLDVPPPRFKPNPPYAPEPVDRYDQGDDRYDPYGRNDDRYNNPPPPAQPARPGDYPTARPTANPNEVISPYEPYNIIDVEGFSSGQLARDPSNQKIFRVP